MSAHCSKVEDLADSKQYKHIEVSSDDDVVIYVGDARSSVRPQDGAEHIPQNKPEYEESIGSEHAPMQTAHRRSPDDPASSDDADPAYGTRNILTDEEGYSETTIDDIESSKMPGIQKVILVLAIIAIVVFVVYSIISGMNQA